MHVYVRGTKEWGRCQDSSFPAFVLVSFNLSFRVSLVLQFTALSIVISKSKCEGKHPCLLLIVLDMVPRVALPFVKDVADCPVIF